MSIAIQNFPTGNQEHACPSCGETHQVSQGKHLVDADFGEAVCNRCLTNELSDIAERYFGGESNG